MIFLSIEWCNFFKKNWHSDMHDIVMVMQCFPHLTVSWNDWQMQFMCPDFQLVWTGKKNCVNQHEKVCEPMWTESIFLWVSPLKFLWTGVNQCGKMCELVWTMVCTNWRFVFAFLLLFLSTYCITHWPLGGWTAKFCLIAGTPWSKHPGCLRAKGWRNSTFFFFFGFWILVVLRLGRYPFV